MSHLLAAALAALAPPAQDAFGDAEIVNSIPGATQDIQTADFDGDALPDLLLVGRPLRALVSPGLGVTTVAAAVNDDSDLPRASAAGDLDGDGIDEVLVQLEGAASVAWVWFATSDQGQSFALAGSSAAADELVRIRLADLDGDGDDDVLAELTTGGLVWYETAGGTPGALALPLFGGALASWNPLDVDGNGLADIVLREEGTDVVTVLAALGGGNFSAPIRAVDTGAPLLTFAAADRDGDGDLDVVFQSAAGISVAENQGGFNFAAPAVVLTTPPGFDSITLTAVTDLDGDGDADIAVDAYAAPFTFAALASLSSGAAGQTVVRFGSGVPYTGAFVGDLTGDGIADVLRTGAESSATLWSGTFAGGRPGTAPAQEVLEPAGLAVPIALADVDGDGVPDVVGKRGDGLAVAFNSGYGLSFDTRGTFALNVDPRALVAADLDGDNDDDLAMLSPLGALTTVEATGTATVLVEWDLQPLEPGQIQAQSLRAFDVDDDGDVDLTYVAFGTNGRQVVVQFSDGTGVGWTRTEVASTAFLPGLAPSYWFADLDGDGVTDLLVASDEGGAARTDFHRGLGAGTFAAPLVAFPGAGSGDLADVDGDGLLDLILRGTGSPRVALRSPGAVAFGPATVDVASLLSIPGNLNLLRDLDGDGIAEWIGTLPTPGAGGKLAVAPGLPGLAFGPPTVELGSGAFSLFAAPPFADMDDDGDLDAVTLESDGQTTRVALYRGEARPRAGTSLCGPAVPNSLGLPARMIAFGQSTPTSTDLELRTVDVPTGTFGIYAVAPSATVPTPVAGSAGNLCLGGAIGRYDGPSQILNAGPEREFRLVIDPTRIERPNGTVPAQAGQTWFFQAWFRDVQGGAGTSNFSNALGITF